MVTMPPRGYRASEEIEIKRSRFIADVARVDTEDEARAFIASVRSMYPDARHHCTAYVIDSDGIQTAHSSDDGEPSGTAGMPMLNCLFKAEVTNIVAVVTRYFGGVKLGAGGLVRAYTDAVAGVLATMPRVVREIHPIWMIHLTHADAGRVQEDLLRQGAALVDTNYDADGVQLRFTFPDDPAEAVARTTQGTVVPILDGEESVEVPVQMGDQSTK